MKGEQRKRMAERSFSQRDEGQADINYTIQVSGERVEIHQDYVDDESEGEEADHLHECWIMSLSTLKTLIECAQWCIQKSEAFEASHKE